MASVGSRPLAAGVDFPHNPTFKWTTDPSAAIGVGIAILHEGATASRWALPVDQKGWMRAF